MGSFVTIRGKRSRFFCVVTDVSLGGSDPRLKHAPAGIQNELIAEIISGTIAYGTDTQRLYVYNGNIWSYYT